MKDTPIISKMVTTFAIFTFALGWFSTLALAFQPTTTTHRSSARLSFGRNQPVDWQLKSQENNYVEEISRRSVISTIATSIAATACTTGLFPLAASAGQPNGLKLSTAPTSGLRWADAKVGSGEIPSMGSITSIDYSMASTAGRFPTIYSTKNGDEPYRWKLGDGTTIRGIELAILGDASEGIPPMRPGGIRRVIVPNSLGNNALIGRDDSNNVILNNPEQQNLSPSSKNQRCMAGAENSLGPIPPKDAPDGAYQRWYQFYCNPRIPYQPDLVLDIKLYGKRGTTVASVSTSN